MTKTRAPLTIENAVMRIIGQIGVAAMAEAASSWLGRDVAERTIYNWSDPSTNERLPAEAVIPLDLAFQAGGGEGAPLFETIATLLEAARAERFVDAAAIARQTISVIKEGGEAHAALVVLTQPNATDADYAEAIREVEQARNELDRTLPLLTNSMGHRGATARAYPRGGKHED